MGTSTRLPTVRIDKILFKTYQLQYDPYSIRTHNHACVLFQLRTLIPFWVIGTLHVFGYSLDKIYLTFGVKGGRRRVAGRERHGCEIVFPLLHHVFGS